MRKRLKWIAALSAILVICLLAASLSLADAGGFSGDTDWGGGDSDWGGSSDWGSSDWGSSDWGSSSDWDDDDVLPIIGSTASAASCVGGDLVTFFIVAIIVIILVRSLRSKKQTGNAAQMYQAAAEEPGLPLETLKQKDPNFNEQKFLETVGNRYIQMQDAWETKKWEPMRAFMTDSLYNQMLRQLQELIAAGETNHIDRIAVLESRITRYAVEGDNDVLVVRLSTRICDYTVNDKTGAVVRGSQARELFMVYDWKLIRQKDMLTLDQPSVTQVSCPNCGAPLDVNHSGKCPYCDTVVTLTDHDWALSAIKGISQRSSN